MFRKPEERQFEGYFLTIRHTEDFYELQSKNTGHYWVVKKCHNPVDGKSVVLFHRHNTPTNRYHKHHYHGSVKNAVMEIKSHDRYVLDHNKQHS